MALNDYISITYASLNNIDFDLAIYRNARQTAFSHSDRTMPQ